MGTEQRNDALKQVIDLRRLGVHRTLSIRVLAADATAAAAAAAPGFAGGQRCDPARSACTKYRWNAKNTISGTSIDRKAPVDSTSMFAPNCLS